MAQEQPHPVVDYAKDEAQAVEGSSPTQPEKKSVLTKAKEKVKKLGSKLKPKSHSGGGEDSAKQEIIDDSIPGNEEVEGEEEASAENPSSQPDSREVPLDEFALIQQKEKQDKDDNFEFKKSDDLTTGLPSQAIAEQQEPSEALQAVPTSYNYNQKGGGLDGKPPVESSKTQEPTRDDQDHPETSAISESHEGERKDGSIFTSEKDDPVQVTPDQVEELSSGNVYTGEPDIKSSSPQEEEPKVDRGDDGAKPNESDESVVNRELDTKETGQEPPNVEDVKGTDEISTEQRELPSEHQTPGEKQEGGEIESKDQLLDDPMGQEQEKEAPVGGTVVTEKSPADEHLGDSKVDEALHESSGVGQGTAETKLEDEISVNETKGSDSNKGEEAQGERGPEEISSSKVDEPPAEKVEDSSSQRDIGFVDVSDRDLPGEPAPSDKKEENFKDAKDEALERTDDTPSVEEIKDKEPQALPPQESAPKPRELEETSDRSGAPEKSQVPELKESDQTATVPPVETSARDPVKEEEPLDKVIAVPEQDHPKEPIVQGSDHEKSNKEDVKAEASPLPEKSAIAQENPSKENEAPNSGLFGQFATRFGYGGTK